MATTPVAALMFRFNNPDALLTLLLALAAYATVRALERASTAWLLLAGALVGFGFLAKMLQALLVVPALAVVYLVAAPTGLRRRLMQLAGAGGALVAAAGWWVAVVELWPASSRPYIGGSQHNSVLELMLGYNGLGRLNGNETGSVTGGVTGPGAWGQTGLGRLFNAEIGGQIAWLLPAAAAMLVVGLWLTRRGLRTDPLRAAFLLWGGWLVVTGLVFSLMAGIFHAYYTVALAPAIAALVGMGGSMLWWYRRHIAARVAMAAVTLGTAIWSVQLLERTPDWMPWLRVFVIVTGVAAAIALLLLTALHRAVAAVAAAVAVGAMLAGPAAYAVETADTPHTGAIPSAGPTINPAGWWRWTAGALGGPPGTPRLQPGGGGPAGGGPGARRGPRARPPQLGPPPRGGGAVGGLLDAGTPGAALVAALQADAGDFTWVGAAVGANVAAGYQLAAREPVMAIGGFNGSDPSPTLAQFQSYVAEGKIHYFLGGGGFVANGGADIGSQITAWVQANFDAVSIGGATMYDLTTPLGARS
jgi:4-amino-4-deoxy-L-arabinose transferase-like glycosyltransferase